MGLCAPPQPLRLVAQRTQAMQALMTKAQAAVFSSDGGGDTEGGAVCQRSKGGTRKDRREAARWRIGRWEELSGCAANWRGRRAVARAKDGLAREPLLRIVTPLDPTRVVCTLVCTRVVTLSV